MSIEYEFEGDRALSGARSLERRIKRQTGRPLGPPGSHVLGSRVPVAATSARWTVRPGPCSNVIFTRGEYPLLPQSGK